MAGQARRTRWSPTGTLFRAFRQRDDATATVVSMVIGTAVFVISTSVLIHFVVRPPGTDEGLQDESLRVRADQAMSVFLGTTGYPINWGDEPSKMNRLGLVKQGASSIVDASKFDAIARGKLTDDPLDAYVDYGAARTALDLHGYDFHLRVAPSGSAFELGSFGVENMETFHIAYISHWDVLETPESKSESFNLDALKVKFANTTRSSLTGTGDKFKDDSSELRSLLVPLLGTNPVSTAIPSDEMPNGNPKRDMRVFQIVEPEDYESLFLPSVRPTLTRALAITNATVDDGVGDLNYTDAKDVRVNLGTANFQGLVTATLSWKEMVDSGNDFESRDAGDFGWVEASADGGATWVPLTYADGLRSQEPLVVTDTWTSQSVLISAANCAVCIGNPEVQIAFHWHADDDNDTGVTDNVRGRGWIIDDVKLELTSATGFHKTFEGPEYDMLVVGSNVAQTAFTPAEVKHAVRDYVQVHGGRLVVLGGQQNTNWLEPLFHVATHTASGGVSNPDTTHPLLGTPNGLDWDGYEYEDTWTFSGGNDAELFTTIIGTQPDEPVLAVSDTGAFGAPGTDGAVILTTFLPYTMTGDEPLKFFANILTYGRYHYLYAEFGPEVPDGISVASVTRTATMDKTRAEIGSFVEMAFTLYLWAGNSTATSTSTGGASAPLSLSASPGNQSITLTWDPPASAGSKPIEKYRVYKGTTYGEETYLGYTTAPITTFVASGLTNGVAYYFNVTAETQVGQGTSSTHTSATPSTAPWVPLSFNAGGAAGAASLTWSPPWSNGGVAIGGYNVYRNVTDQPSTLALYTQVGPDAAAWTDTNVTVLCGGVACEYAYKIAAKNALGEGDHTAVKTAVIADVLPSAPTLNDPTSTLNTIVLTWAPPASPGSSAVDHYVVYYSASSPPTTELGTSATPTFEHNGLTPGQTFYYRVSAVNDEGEGAFSAIKSGTTLAPPNQPLSVIVSNASMGPQALSLNWTAPVAAPGATITDYKIYRGTTSGGEVYLGSTGGTNTSFADRNGLAHNTTYYYKVSAVAGGGGEGALSTEQSANTYGTPWAPTIVVTPQVGKKMLIVTTPPASNGGLAVTGYNVYYCVGSGCATAFLEADADGTYTHNGLTAGVTYTYQVTAINAIGESPKSPAKTGTALL